MQLSAPSFPFNVNPASPATASAGKPADNAPSAAPGFGELLKAETKASSPSPRPTVTPAAKRAAKAAAEPDPGKIAEDDSSDSDDPLAPDDDLASRQGAVGSWLSANGIVQNPTLVHALSCFTGEGSTAAAEMAGTAETSTDLSTAANGLASPEAARGTAGAAQKAGLAIVASGQENLQSIVGQASDLGSRAAAEFRSLMAEGLSLRGGKITSPSNQDLASNIQPSGATGDQAVPVNSDPSSNTPASDLANQTKTSLSANQDSTDATATTDLAATSNSVPSAVEKAVADPAAIEFNHDGARVKTEPAQPLNETALEESALGLGASDADASTQTRSSSASANSVRVQAAIEQARLQNIPPGSLVAEKFADPSGRFSEAPRSTEKNGERKLFGTNPQQVAGSYTPVGINAAKEQASMPALPTTTPPPSGVTESISSPSPVSFESLVKTGTADAGLASGAARAVESAVAMAERFSSADRSSVNLQFNVSGVDLAVRVEMKHDGVHTTFRTDSPELRAALAQEWHSVTAQTPDRPVRLADPTFASHTSESSLQSNAGSGQQRESNARNNQSFSDQFSSARGGARLQPSVVSAISTAPVAMTAAPGRLHAFA